MLVFWNFQLNIGGTAGGDVTAFTPTLMASIPNSSSNGSKDWVVPDNDNILILMFILAMYLWVNNSNMALHF